jgi:HD domain
VGRERADVEPRWVGHPVLATCIRAIVAVVPGIAGLLTGLGLAAVVPRPDGPAFFAWLGALLVSACIAVAIVERLASRLLPIATLLKLSLAFPDKVPSRFRVARAAGNPRVLAERIRLAREKGLDDDPTRAAERILGLVAALSVHDRKTRGHSERVRAFTDLLAVEVGLAAGERDRLRWAALLHDIGKLEVPSVTLNKNGKPDEAEWELIKRHPLEGQRIAAPLLPWLGAWGDVIAQHHERFDGTGYPASLAGTSICLGARIVTIADAFEVMTAARSYKRPMTPTAARRELARCAGTHFDSDIVRAFFSISIGRLWWTVGPASWLAQAPFALRLARSGDLVVTGARMATGVAMQAVAGVVAVALATTAGARSAPELVPDRTPRRSQIRVEATLGPGMSTFAGAASGDDAPDDRSGPSSAPADDGSAPSEDPPRDAVDATTETVGDTVNNTTDAVRDAVDNTTDTLGDTVTDVADTADGVISDTPIRDTVDAGSTIGGVTEDAEGLTNDATDAVDATTDAVLGLGG